MRSILEKLRENLQSVDERMNNRYLLVGQDAYTMYSFDEYIRRLINQKHIMYMHYLMTMMFLRQ